MARNSSAIFLGSVMVAKFRALTGASCPASAAAIREQQQQGADQQPRADARVSLVAILPRLQGNSDLVFHFFLVPIRTRTSRNHRGEPGHCRMRRVEAANPSLTVGALSLGSRIFCQDPCGIVQAVYTTLANWIFPALADL